jgi:hypothetical protein
MGSVVPPAERSCDGCTLCCELVPVERLGKPAFTPCKFQLTFPSVKTGCSIYAKRPDSCRFWSCTWLLNPTFTPELHPKRCGLVVDEQFDLISINDKEMPAVQIWVARGHEDDYKNPDLEHVYSLLMSLVTNNLAVLWRMPYKPGETPMAVAMFLQDGKLTISPPHASTDTTLGDTASRMIRADQLAEKL